MMTEDEIRKFLNGDLADDFDTEFEEKKKDPVIKKIKFPHFDKQPKLNPKRHNYDFLKQVKLDIAAELGTCKIKVKDLLGWKQGSVVPLSKMAGEAVDLYVNEKPLATGEIIIINDSFGVRITTLEDQKGKK